MADTTEEEAETPQQMCLETWPKIFENQVWPLEKETISVIANKLCPAFIPDVPGKVSNLFS